ncbi:MAG: NUDIX domain-containing protein [Gammaproteobacteria bacterium]|nr:NUDIX domain-containing protein [Gammaproteobacteria bacterium]MCW8908980.1 NUDIX domain-containing protein [Gammaproteobacteria bacterium]MCW9006006.1 NUDIX domain-containing protein [Gammaproteobacteria bacterium]MCW9055646.1 NUDIX domain-containing protein [Gammaproteobacteria bacterium]
MKWELINRKSLFSGFFKVDQYQIRHDLFAGGETEITRELFHRGDAVAVLLYDPAKDRVVMIEQFRVGAIDDEQGPWLLEIVAGVVEEGESPNDVARRECAEEAGIEVHAFETIHTFYSSPGGCSEKIFLLCGLVDSDKANGIHGLPEEGEDIKVSVLEYDEIVNLLGADHISSAIPIIALQWLQLNRERLRIESFVM